MDKKRPMILAPAGDTDSFLAALAAGADAVYCGLKIFSARMEAGNFSMEELASLAELARSRGVEVYVALNSLIKDAELEKTARIIQKLADYVRPHALIVQDLGVLGLAEKAGFKGELHLSTLANCTFGEGLRLAGTLGFSRVVLPRELHVDEIKSMAAGKPRNLELETFVHGALCYGVSGRCYWSSWFGGKSSLRGRCVQPCRRLYSQGARKERFFSCMDLSLDVLARVLGDVSGVTTWKIEGRKKGPHYVFYTVRGYRMLRDEGRDPARKKTALAFLEHALGRPSTHYHFLPQRPQNPLKKDVETGSGLLVGRVKGGPKSHVITREALLRGDLLRIGYEDGRGHTIQRVTRSVPKKGKLVLKRGAGGYLPKGAPVFIVDRREPEVTKLIKELREELSQISPPTVRPRPLKFNPAGKTSGTKGRKKATDIRMTVSWQTGRTRSRGERGCWLSKKGMRRLPFRSVVDTWWWLPPVVWPEDEAAWQDMIREVISKGARRFVLNMPWQAAWFKGMKGLTLWAGPFCNIANKSALGILKTMGFAGAIVSPELGRDDFISLAGNSPISLGVVLDGNWPVSISRIVSEEIKIDAPFVSPKGETGWVSRRGGNYWVFPGWRLNLASQRSELQRAGYTLFVSMEEILPRGISLKERPGLWNWNLRLL